MAVEHLNKDNFGEAISKGTTIVDFWASWCGPCKMLGPVFEELSSSYEGKVKFAKVSTEENPDLATQHEIRSIPCLVIFKDGKESDRIIGFMPKEELKEKIDSLI